MDVGVSESLGPRTRDGTPHERCADQHDERRPEDGPEIDAEPLLLIGERPQSREDERDAPEAATLPSLQKDARPSEHEKQWPGGAEEVLCVGPPQIVREQAQSERDDDDADDDDAEGVRAAFEIARVFGLHEVHSSRFSRA